VDWYAIDAILMPVGLIISKHLVSSKFCLRSLPPAPVALLIVFLVIYGNIVQLDPNFLSFYIACLLALVNWFERDKFIANKFLLVVIYVFVSMVLKSRAFTYATGVYIVAGLVRNRLSAIEYRRSILSFVVISLVIVYISTWSDGQIVHLSRFEQSADSLQTPSLYEKLKNFSDINRFRISREWIEGYLLSGVRNFLIGIGPLYNYQISHMGYYPAHNAFLDVAVKYGVPYLGFFLYCLIENIKKVNKSPIDILYLSSFGMVLHGIFYLGLLPFYFIIAVISNKRIDKKNHLLKG